MVRWVLRRAVLAAVVLAGCSRSAPSIDIGPSGGSVALPADRGPRVALEVPVDAVVAPLPFQLRALAAAPAGAVGPAIEATPHGATFAKPVALRFSPKLGELASGISFGELRVATLKNGKWEQLPTSFPAPGVIEGLTTHFSTFALVAPCHVSGIGTDFPLTDCPTFTPRVQTSSTANLEARAGPVTLTVRIRPTPGAGTGTLTISGLRAGWTYFLARDGSGQLSTHTATPAGVVSFAQDLAGAHRLVLMAQHGSFTLTSTTCSQFGAWNATTRTCTLTDDIKEPPVWVEEDNLTLDCAGRSIGGAARQSLGVYVDSRTNISLRNCTITNVDTGVQGAVDGLQVSNLVVTNPASAPYGSAGFNLGEATNIAIAGSTVERFSQGISFSGGGTQVTTTTLRGTQVAVHVEGGTGVLLDGLHLDSADAPPETNVPGAILIQVGDATVRNLTTSGSLAVYGSVVAAMFDSTVTVDGAQISRARVGVRLDGPGDSIVTNSTFSINEVSLQLNGGLNHVFHNNFISNHSHSVVAATAVELSDTRAASPTFHQGNFWGRACPGPLFSVDDAINATDSFPYGVASSWTAGGAPGCAATPPLAPPVLTAPAPGALLNSAKPSFAGSAAPNGLVEILEGGAVIASGTADPSGAFAAVPALPLAEGAHAVAARVTALAQTSALSSAVAFSIGTVAPFSPVVLFPAPGATLFESAPLVVGTAEPGARVDLMLDGVLRGSGSAEASGAFSVRLVGVLAGPHSLVAKAIDAAGNASPPSASVAFTVVLAGPPLPGSAGLLRVDTFGDYPDAFEASAGESNVVAVTGGFTRPNGSGGPNAQFVLLVARDVTTGTGSAIRTLSTQVPLPNAPGFAASIGWDGRNAAGQLMPAGVYLSTVRLTAVRTSNGSNSICLAQIALGCVVDTLTFGSTAEVAVAPLLARPPIVPAAASIVVQAAALLPAQGRVLVLPEAAFNAALAAGNGAPAGTAARQNAVALAGNATDSRSMGMLGELQLSNTPTSFSGETFIVARAAGSSAGGRYVETNDFFVASCPFRPT